MIVVDVFDFFVFFDFFYVFHFFLLFFSLFLFLFLLAFLFILFFLVFFACVSFKFFVFVRFYTFGQVKGDARDGRVATPAKVFEFVKSLLRPKRSQSKIVFATGDLEKKQEKQKGHRIMVIGSFLLASELCARGHDASVHVLLVVFCAALSSGSSGGQAGGAHRQPGGPN